MVGRLRLGIIPDQTLGPVCELDVCLVENSRPLERCLYSNSSVLELVPLARSSSTDPVQPLARCAVAVFAGQRLVSAQLVLDPAAVALACPLGFKLASELIRRLISPFLAVSNGRCWPLVSGVLHGAKLQMLI